jgi:hypothetical protein
VSKRIIIYDEELQEVFKRLDKIEEAVKLKQKHNEQIWFDNAEFIQVMNVSKRTAMQWRQSSLIAYSQVQNKIYYQLKDILDLLNKFYHPSQFEI